MNAVLSSAPLLMKEGVGHVDTEEDVEQESRFQNRVACLWEGRWDLPVDGFPASSTDGHVGGRLETICASDTVAEAPIP